jgi:uncharacterized membrane protein
MRYVYQSVTAICSCAIFCFILYLVAAFIYKASLLLLILLPVILIWSALEEHRLAKKHFSSLKELSERQST